MVFWYLSVYTTTQRSASARIFFILHVAGVLFVARRTFYLRVVVGIRVSNTGVFIIRGST